MKNKPLGHQAPKGFYRQDKFNSIEIEGDFAYCKSHNFVYNPDIEEKKLYNAQPCFYTDVRYKNDGANFYKRAYIFWRRKIPYAISLKNCIHRINKVRNIPKGTIVNFEKSWYYPGVTVDTRYLYRIHKERKFDPKYEINDPLFQAHFTNNDKSNILIDALREKGFLVKVYPENKTYDESECAVAYGFNKKVGISPENETVFGYGDGRDHILWDHYGEFDKWSRCHWIPKTDSIEEIVSILINTKPEEY